jgi:hypothetical protein
MDVLDGVAFRKRWRGVATALLALLTFDCGVDSPVIFQAEPGAPEEVRPGIFRLTYHLEPDLYPTWIDSVTVSYRGRGLPPYDTGLVLLQRSIRGGPATEREAKYRAQAAELSLVPVSVPAIAGEPYLVYWIAAKNGVALCSVPCPPAAAQGLRVLDPSADDTLVALPGWTLLFDRLSHVAVGNNQVVRLRLLPEDLDARDRWMNPFGPAYGLTPVPLYVSSGTVIFSASGSPASPTLDSVTTGSHPAVSRNGSVLAFSRTTIAGSTTGTCSIAFGLGACIQTTVTLLEGGREIWVRDLSTGDERSLGQGWAPAFDVTGTRVAVTTPAGLDWIEVASGARSPIPNTAGAHSPAVSPEGEWLAFVAQWSGQPDVYFMAIPRP